MHIEPVEIALLERYGALPERAAILELFAQHYRDTLSAQDEPVPAEVAEIAFASDEAPVDLASEAAPDASADAPLDDDVVAPIEALDDAEFAFLSDDVGGPDDDATGDAEGLDADDATGVFQAMLDDEGLDLSADFGDEEAEAEEAPVTLDAAPDDVDDAALAEAEPEDATTMIQAMPDDEEEPEVVSVESTQEFGAKPAGDVGPSTAELEAEPADAGPSTAELEAPPAQAAPKKTRKASRRSRKKKTKKSE